MPLWKINDEEWQPVKYNYEKNNHNLLLFKKFKKMKLKSIVSYG